MSILAAEYTSGTNKYPPTLYINRITDGRRSNVAAFNVSGKREARKLAKQHNAVEWNF
jgi:hypothetical protein